MLMRQNVEQSVTEQRELYDNERDEEGKKLHEFSHCFWSPFVGKFQYKALCDDSLGRSDGAFEVCDIPKTRP